MHHHFLLNNIDNITPCFHLKLTDNGVDNLDPTLTINGQAVTPVFRYKGGDANATNLVPWGYGETLTAAGSGGTFNAGSPYMGSNDDSFNPDGTRYYQASGNSFGDITTEDFVIECIFKTGNDISTSNANYTVSHWVGNSGYVLFVYNNAINFQLDASANKIITPISKNTWYHCIVFVDASGSMVMYLNAIASTAADISSLGSLTTSTTFKIGSGNPDLSNVSVSYAAMWKQSNWLDTHLQATIAQERFYKLSGIYPQIAKGTALPTSYTRATTATLDKYESASVRKLYTVGAGHPRVCHRKDTNGLDVYGYLPESAATNLCTDSEDFTAAAWTATRCTVSGELEVAPDGETTADLIYEDGTAANSHYIYDSISFTSGTKYVASIFAKAVNRSWLTIELTNTAAFPANVYAYFDLSTGSVGTTGAGADSSGIEDWGNGWFRCWISSTADATALSSFTLYLAEGDNDITFDGLNQASLYLWGAVMEAGVDYPTSYVKTSGGTTQRNADILYYKGDDGNLGGVGSLQRGSMECKMLLPSHTTTTFPYLLTLSDGGSANDRIGIYVTSNDRGDVFSRGTGENNGAVIGTSDVIDGVDHTLRATWKTNSLIYYFDGTSEGTPDTDCGMPDQLDRIHIGSAQTSTGQINGLISDVKILTKPKKPFQY